MTFPAFLRRTTLAIGLACAFGAAAHADTGEVSLTSTAPSAIKVLSNGTTYTQLDGQIVYRIKGRLKFDAGTAGRVRSWGATPVMKTSVGLVRKVPGLAKYSMYKTYPRGSRPKRIDKNLEFFIPAAAVEKEAVNMCNFRAKILRQQGKSDAEIFAKTWEVHFTLSALPYVDSTGAGSKGQFWGVGQTTNYRVLCMKTKGPRMPAAGNGALSAGLRIHKATMKLSEVATKGGACQVKTVTAISTTQPGATLKYRFIHSSGKKSGVFTTKTAGNKIAVVTHTWDVPNGPGTEVGWLQLQVLSPKTGSNKAGYNMRCSTPGPGGLTGKPKRPPIAPGSGTMTN